MTGATVLAMNRRVVATISVIMTVVLLAGSYFAWSKWGGLVTNRGDRLLAAKNIEVTPQPPWIRTDVAADVFRDGGFSRLSILDQRVTVQVARAFALHPWERGW